MFERAHAGVTWFVLSATIAAATPQQAAPPDPGARPRLTFAEVEREFASPSMRYAPFAFWFWDAPLDPAQAASMAEEMCRQGLNPGYAHARRGLPREQWLSPLWFESFAAALGKAEEAEAFLGYCDEYWWPSGRAAGRVFAEHPELRAVSLECRTLDVAEGSELECPESFFTMAARHAKPFTPPVLRPELGEWIWCPEAMGEGRVAWFRCPVVIADGATITAAHLLVSADNQFVLHVDGERVASGDDWMEPALVELTPYLHPGENVVAVMASNLDGPCGLNFGLRIELADGATTWIGSGPECRTSDAPAPGWTSAGFDDSSWLAPVLLGDVNAAPWHVDSLTHLREPATIRSETLESIGAGEAFTWSPEVGSWRVYSFAKVHHPGIDGGNVNYLDRRLIPTFLELAHEPYEEAFGEEMGASIPGVFVDNEGDYGWKIAWSDDLEREYRERTGEDIRRSLPLLLDRDEEGRWPAARWSWYEAVSKLYADNYLGGVSRWLEERGMYCISNLWEESLSAQAYAVGDFFAAQRSVTMPGNDCLVHKALLVHDFKETQSVSEFESRRFQSEVLGVAGWQMSPTLMKRAANAVVAWGVSHIAPHGVNLNRRLESIPYPPDWYTSNPYWPYLHLWTDFCRRACFVNSCGHAAPDVLLLNPMDSVWALLGGRVFDPDSATSFSDLFDARVATGEPGPDLGELEAVYARAIDELTAARVQYLVTDAHYLREMRLEEGGRLVRGPFAFEAIVVPSTFVLPLDVAKRLADFAEAGGAVFLLGELPRASTERGLGDPRLEAEVRRLLAQPTVKRAAEGIATLVERGDAHLRPHVEVLTGELELLDLHRRIDGRDFFWLVNDSSERRAGRLAFRGARGGVSTWSCETGVVGAIASEQLEGESRVQLELEPYEALWLVFDPEREPTRELAVLRPKRIPRHIALDGAWRVTCDLGIQPPPPSPDVVPAIPEALLAEGGVEHALGDWSELGLEGFSGYLDYHTTFTLDDVSGNTRLDLGDVLSLAEVWVNGERAGARLWPPFELDVTALVHPGENELTVRVGNLLCNAMTRFSNWGWSPPSAEDFRCGLFGPVTIVRE